MTVMLLFFFGHSGVLSQPSPQQGVGVKSAAYEHIFEPERASGGIWTNRLTGTIIQLGAEFEVEVGDKPELAKRVAFRWTGKREAGPKEEWATADYASEDGSLTAKLTLRADPKWPLMHKDLVLTNSGSSAVRVLNVVFGRFPSGDLKTEGGDRGFPLYLDGQFFVSLAHPAGFAHVEGKEVVLRQYPGVLLQPGQSFRSMEAIYGVAKKGEARRLFVDYVKSRMARTVNHHDKPLSILEAFGGQQEGDFKVYYARGVAEEYLHKHLLEVVEANKKTAAPWDYYSIEFWHDRAGDFTGFNKANFPNGFDRVKKQILDLGMKPGLWIVSSSPPDWTIDQNPTVQDCFTAPDHYAFCRACEPINALYKQGFTWQMSENKVGLLKFDGLTGQCDNPAHSHLPGPLYSTEAIYNGVVDVLRALRRASPDVFLMLYWGYRSPWWLEYGDTYFECGDQIEAASPAQYPTPYARDAVTQRLDQAQTKITDTPWMGKDSLGVWLSNWAWNSGIGKDRWQEGLIMDMARGGLLFQIWTDEKWLTPPERKQVATFLKLFKANGDCFGNTRFFMGDPNKEGPYGYTCTNGKKAFLAIHNACMKDSDVPIRLGPEVGLPSGKRWDVYRWWPKPAKIAKDVAAGLQPASGNSRRGAKARGAAKGTQAEDLRLRMRPYEVDLIEIVPAGTKPSLAREFDIDAASLGWNERTQELTVEIAAPSSPSTEPCQWVPLTPCDFYSKLRSKLYQLPDGSILASGTNSSYDSYTFISRVQNVRVTGLMLETLPDPSLPGNGPGRAVNGNFALTNLYFEMNSPHARVGTGITVKVKSAKADFSQVSFGGWPVEAAVDGSPKTGWSIHPQTGIAHAAVFTLEMTLHLLGANAFNVVLTGGDNGHNLGRFRLWITTDPKPDLPLRYQPGIITLSSTLPPTKTGGLVVIAGGNPEDKPHALLDGKEVKIVPVWAPVSNWGCPWTAWRMTLGPSPVVRRLEVKMERMQTRAGASFRAWWLPR